MAPSIKTVGAHGVSSLTGAALALALTFITGWEGIYTKPYYDSVGVLTVCIGETAADGVNFKKNYTVQDCKDLLVKSLVKYDEGLRSCLHPALPLTDNMHIAFLSTTYNIGVEGFCHSSMARNVNRGNFKAACHSLRLWNKGGGRVIKGLDNRRKAEEALCLKGL